MARFSICLSVVAMLSIGHVPSAKAANAACQIFDGAIIVTQDGKYLGKIADRYDQDSIFNKYGNFGSKYNFESIWNPYGENGGKYQMDSWSNPYSSNPPLIVKEKQVIAVLSVNKNVKEAVNPLLIGVLCYEYEPAN
ncbi:hypothetical protein [Novosphingobium rosa]|uniref:hypothetical protein n=1 Tax=Novosphingobium rosa TaxID=76978 RepID=UPI0012ED2C53|nr:hypothetical protein [Novosphingobium rosa]